MRNQNFHYGVAEPTTGPHPEIPSLKTSLILSSHLYLGFPNVFIPLRFSIKMAYACHYIYTA